MAEADNRLKPTEWLIALTLFLLALVINLIRLNNWAPLPDEVNYALSARYLLTHRTFIGQDIMFFPPLFVYLSALLQRSGIELLLSVRLLSAIAGASILPLLYLASRRWYKLTPAFLTAITLLFLFALHLYSRLGQVEILTLLFIILGFYLLLNQKPLPAGIALGTALWAKETAIGAIISALLFLMFFPGRRRSIGLLIAGIILPLLPLAVLGFFTGYNLLYEITAQRGYDINMLKLSPVSSLLALGAGIGFNLFPRVFTPLEFFLALLFAPPLILLLFYLVIKGGIKKFPPALLTDCYLAIHLPFFFLFTRKFDYYLLPAAIFLLWSGVNELIAGTRPKFIRIAGALLVAALLLFNIYAGKFLYFDRGTHKTFLTAVADMPPDITVATSHPSLVEYIARKMDRGLKTLPLFKPNGYSLNPEVIEDTTVKTVLLKKFYYDRLRQEYPSEWEYLARQFPEKREIIDPTWSVWFVCQRDSSGWKGWKKSLAGLIKPTGVVIFRRL